MILSFSVITAAGLFFGWLCKKIKFPALFGMMVAGIIIGPYCLDLIDGSVLDISADIRKIALVLILLRAGLTLNISDLKKIGRSAVLMCFLPACFEIAGMILLAPLFLGVTRLEAAIMGSVVAAVSPAVVVPKMIKLIENRQGTEKSIPQLILAGASVDDVFVIVMFGAFTGIAKGTEISAMTFASVPVSIITGIAAGFVIGKLTAFYFEKIKMRDTVKMLVLLAVSLAVTAAENMLPSAVPFSGLIGVMFTGISFAASKKEKAAVLSVRLNKLWVGAEIFLFVLVGAAVNVSSALEYGIKAVFLILAVLVFRAAGVVICILGTKLSMREKLFCIAAYMPKATVQAAIGGIPLAMNLPCGSVVLTVSVLAVLITAPLGAFGIDFLGKYLETEKNI